MKASKRVFVVIGSEDGVLGVYSTFKRAYENAARYVVGADGGNRELSEYSKNYRIMLKGTGWETIEAKDSNFASANIQAIFLNGVIQ